MSGPIPVPYEEQDFDKEHEVTTLELFIENMKALRRLSDTLQSKVQTYTKTVERTKKVFSKI